MRRAGLAASRSWPRCRRRAALRAPPRHTRRPRGSRRRSPAACCGSPATCATAAPSPPRGLHWRAAQLPRGARLLSFEVATTWQACTAPAGPCTRAADTTATPFAARRYVAGHADVGRYLRVTETAAEVVETDPATFTFHVLRASRTRTTLRAVAAYPAGRAPATAFMNGLPERRTGSDSERFQVAAPHFNPADGTPVARFRVDGRPWAALPAGRRLRAPAGSHSGATASGCASRTPPARRRGRSAGGSCRCRRRGRALPGPASLLVPAAPRPHRPPDAVGLADRPGDAARAHRRARRRHLRHRRLPDDRRRGARDPHVVAGGDAAASARLLLHRPGVGGLPARRHARRRRVPGADARQRLLRVPAGALDRRARAARARCRCSSRASACARPRASTPSSSTTSTASTRRRRRGST